MNSAAGRAIEPSDNLLVPPLASPALPLPSSLRIAEIAATLSWSLDLASCLAPWHSLRTCILGMRIADEFGLPDAFREALYYALLLHGAGRHAPRLLTGKPNPLISQIVLLAQTLVAGPSAAQTGTDPDVSKTPIDVRFERDPVRAASLLGRHARFSSELPASELAAAALDLDPLGRTVAAYPATLEEICQSVGAVVDDRSALGVNHSQLVANTAVAIAGKLALDTDRTQQVRYAALLHDVGKVAVRQSILRKPGPLTPPEWRIMAGHVAHTWHILQVVPGFEQISEIAASHHERLDGSGYFRGLTARQLSLEARILMVADIFEAMRSDRPYRAALTPWHILLLLRKSIGHTLDAECVEALQSLLDAADGSAILR